NTICSTRGKSLGSETSQIVNRIFEHEGPPAQGPPGKPATCYHYFGSRLHSFGMKPPPKKFAPTTIGWSDVTWSENATFGAGSGAPFGIGQARCLVACVAKATVFVPVSPG